MSQKAQYTYAKLKEEYDQGALAADEITEAKLFAQAVETQLLKAPASAVFCDLQEMVAVPQNGGYVVSGHVDSQNSYGAMVRTPYKITVIKQDGEWKNADKFISTEASMQSKFAARWVLYLVISALSTLALYWFFRMTM